MVAHAVKKTIGSAAIPGDDSVTSELKDEDWLSRGSLSKSCRSTSVWKVGSFSSKSAALSTVTLVDELSTLRLISRVRGTVERTGTRDVG